MSGVVHIAGADVQVGPVVRQRCSWCGCVLIDADLSRMAFQIGSFPEGQEPRPAMWPIGALVRVEGDPPHFRASSLVEHQDGEPVPPECCAALDPAVTA